MTTNNKKTTAANGMGSSDRIKVNEWAKYASERYKDLEDADKRGDLKEWDAIFGEIIARYP